MTSQSDFARADAELVHSLELAIKRALHALSPIAHDSTKPKARTPSADDCGRAYWVLMHALITVERGLRDQLKDPHFVDFEDERLIDLMDPMRIIVHDDGERAAGTMEH